MIHYNPAFISLLVSQVNGFNHKGSHCLINFNITLDSPYILLRSLMIKLANFTQLRFILIRLTLRLLNVFLPTKQAKQQANYLVAPED